MSMDLEQLLREADATMGAPPQQIGDLGAAVRSLARRRRSWRVGGGVAATAAVAMLSVFFAAKSHREPATARHIKAASPEEHAHLMASLGAEAKARMAIVKRLAAAEREYDFVRRIASPDPLLAVRREQEKAAFILVYEADRRSQRPDQRSRAAEEYRRVLALFPETHWASVARDRLVELDGSSHAPNLGTNPEMS